MVSAINSLVATAKDTSGAAERLLQQGHKVVRVLGRDAPYELLVAAGCTPVRLVAQMDMETPITKSLIGTQTLGLRGRSLLEQILNDGQNTPLLITHTDNELPQIFAALRELFRTGDIPQRPVHFLDLLHLPRESTHKYNRVRIQQLVSWLEQLTNITVNDNRWLQAVSEHQIRVDLLHGAQGLRDSENARITAAEFFAMHAAAYILPHSEWKSLMLEAIDDAKTRSTFSGKRLIIAGAPQVSEENYTILGKAGYQIVGDFQDWGESLPVDIPETDNWLDALAAPQRNSPAALVTAELRGQHFVSLAQQTHAGHFLYLTNIEDEPSLWDAETIQNHLRKAGINTGIWQTDKNFADEDIFSISQMTIPGIPGKIQSKPGQTTRPERHNDKRSKKSLASIADFGTYQRAWFQGVRRQVADGAPFAVVNANAPQEILRAMDLPFVVNQWWASIAAAKQQTKRYTGLLREHGYPGDVESYSAQGLAALFDHDEELAPWGGLPTPNYLLAVNSTESTPRIFEHWARESNAALFIYERTVDSRIDISPNWWETLHEHWDSELEEIRIDLLIEEIREVINSIEQHTDRRFDAEKFNTIMHLVNEQEEYYLLTRDLLAQAYPVPVSIVDTMPATMVPQWHRGTEWAREAAKSFYEEVKNKVEAGESVCSNERLRLMWIGRGLWSDMSFYQRWQDSHGAVFIWSMYLALAADGYIRKFDNNRDPMRALAARFITMGDELRMPTWAGAWYVKEAQTHGIHGAIALSDADPFVLRALERAGIPVLALQMDNFHQADNDLDENDLKIEQFLNQLGSRQDYPR